MLSIRYHGPFLSAVSCSLQRFSRLAQSRSLSDEPELPHSVLEPVLRPRTPAKLGFLRG